MNETGFVKRIWVYHAEWAALMAAILGCFLFVHNEAVRVTERLDNHISSINDRCDDLHKEFYELLKELRGKNLNE